jgi:hypothetical protein
MPPTRVDEPLARVLARIDPQQRLRVYRLWTFWADEVGAAIAARAQPTAFRGGLLTVAVNGHAWMQELQFLKETLRERLNARLGQAAITDIYFVPGSAAADPGNVVVDTAPDEAELAAPIELPALRNSEFADAFARLIRAHRRRQRAAPSPPRSRG